MLKRALQSGPPFAWVTGNKVYGSERNLRVRLERWDVPHVLAVKTNERLWSCTDKGPLRVRTDKLASQVDESE